MRMQGDSEGARESALVEGACAGDVAAFERLVALYQDRIYSYIRRLCGDAVEAEDLAQEVFVKAFGSIRRFRGTASFRTWIYRIATNLCVDALRRRRRSESQAVPLDEPTDTGEGAFSRDLPDAGRGPEELVEAQELQQHLAQALGSLSDKLRTVVVLFDIQGLSYEEIAQVMGCPMGTVKSRLFNARMQLRERLRPYISPEEGRRDADDVR